MRVDHIFGHCGEYLITHEVGGYSLERIASGYSELSTCMRRDADLVSS